MSYVLGKFRIKRRAGGRKKLPEMKDALEDEKEDLEQWDPSIYPAYPGLPFFAQTVNAGPQVICPFHFDPQNMDEGWCGIHANGRFDHKRHGFFVLEQLKGAMEFAPGDYIFMNSAAVCHGMTPIGKDEIQRSWTMFTAGSLFQFDDAGCRTLR